MEVIDNVIKESHGLQGHKTFTLKNSVKAFNILSDSLYMNKVLAVIRELSTNAFDGHIGAGTQHLPFDIHLPCDIEPFFYIRDYGTGLSHDQVLNLYTTYFDSTKTDSVDATGALGLGSKSPFSLTDDFSVTSFQDGVAKTYFAYKDDHGFPSISFVGETDTSEPNGMKVQFAVRKDKFEEFHANLQKAVHFFEVKPNIISASNLQIQIKPELYTIDRRDTEGFGWTLARKNVDPKSSTKIHDLHYFGDAPLCVMARVIYPIDIGNLTHAVKDEEDLKYLKILTLPIRLFVRNRSLDYTPSRENLQYTKKTVNEILRILKEIYYQLQADLHFEFAECKTREDVTERLRFLNKLSEKNYKTSPWKEHIRKFGPNVVEVIAPIFTNIILGKNNNLKIDNFGKEFSRCFIEGAYRTASKKLCDIGVFQYEAKQVKNVIGNLIARYSTIDHNFKDQLPDLSVSSGTKNGDFKKRLAEFRAKLTASFSRNTYDHLIKVDKKTISPVDSFGNSSILIDEVIDIRRTEVTIKIQNTRVETVIVIDDYPAGKISTIARAAYHQAQDNGFTQYIVLSHAGKKFAGEEFKIFKNLIESLAKKSGTKVMLASQLTVPEALMLVASTTNKKEKCQYDGINVLTFDASMFSQRGSFKEHEASQNLLERLNFGELEWSNEDVVYVRRQFNNVYLVGNPDQVPAIKFECKYGETSFREFKDLLTLVSLASGKDLISNKRFVVIKTKNVYEKAKKSKWTSFEDYLMNEIKQLTNEQFFALIAYVNVCRPVGTCKFIPEGESKVSKFHTRVSKILTNVFSAEEIEGMKKTYNIYRADNYEIMKLFFSSINGTIANLGCVNSTSTNHVDTLISDFNALFQTLPSGSYKTAITPIRIFFENAKKAKDAHHTLNQISSNHYIMSGETTSIIYNYENFLKFIQIADPDRLETAIMTHFRNCVLAVKDAPNLVAFSSFLNYSKLESSYSAASRKKAVVLIPHLHLSLPKGK